MKRKLISNKEITDFISFYEEINNKLKKLGKNDSDYSLLELAYMDKAIEEAKERFSQTTLIVLIALYQLRETSLVTNDTLNEHYSYLKKNYKSNGIKAFNADISKILFNKNSIEVLKEKSNQLLF